MRSILPPGPFCLSSYPECGSVKPLPCKRQVKPLPCSEVLVLVFHHHNSNITKAIGWRLWQVLRMGTGTRQGWP